MNNNKVFNKENDISVTIVLPNYNKEKYIEESINSVLSQTFKNWNLIIIDDNSSDNSKKIIKKYNRENINFIFLKKNKGVSFCRNLGIRLSKSKYISFLDSDDYWSPEKLEEQVAFMEKFNYEFTYTDYTPFTSKSNIKLFKKRIISPKKFNYDKFINNTAISMSSVLLQKNIIGLTKFPKVKICEDYYFKCQILKKINFAFKLTSNTMFYRITKNSLQSNKFRNLYWVWYINKYYNRLSFFKNLKSLFFIVMSSISRYGIK